MKNERLVKYGCYTSSVSMAILCNVPPMLFLTFRELYSVSYSMLGLLVLINFVTQLAVDLVFSFFARRFNIPFTVKAMPFVTILGLMIFALAPVLGVGMTVFGLVAGTVVFSIAGGLGEVLTSPIIASLPSDNPEAEMSKLHSVYAFGVVGVIPFSTLFLHLVGNDRWWLLIAILTAVPLLSGILLLSSRLPEVKMGGADSGALSVLRERGVWLFVFAIFLGGAAECTMSQWASGYLELALGIPKVWGDLVGVAAFALMLGLGRMLYAKRGKNIGRVIFAGSVFSSVCYLTAALSPIPVLGLFACGMTGLATAMFWPGNLIGATEKYGGGIVIYALMAAGGDLGASVGPQLIGVITDTVSKNPAILSFSGSLGLSADQIGMRIGMLIGSLFCLAAIPTYLFIWRRRVKVGLEAPIGGAGR